MSDMDILQKALAEVEAGSRIPYLGAGVSALSQGGAPASPEALDKIIEGEVRVPKRAQGNLWSAAQYVESRKFRATLVDIVNRAFEPDEGGNPVHDWLARVRPPMVVDTWYDDGLIKAYEGASWGWVQGWSRNGEWIEIWNKAFAPDGTELEAPNPDWASLIYKPHGIARKGSSFLLSDSDYVEVLTEIDIQTPIPEEVRHRRTNRSFLFLGCRFDDQMLRIFARQIVKRSGGNHVAVIEGEVSRMEQKFLDEMGIVRVNLPVSAVVEALASEPA
ncbi:SIR2 family protein [Mangrovicoccus sp. HB161399]|uniref:SIR2 family NAD-dependent protein deacylase n=1 Tax=Mangrovicoccus sp. HB161399 TaxID=2720392 RepID=UPI0015517854|nr:SIR2 family protein [Mangrovicoccus sp. HB161399]